MADARYEYPIMAASKVIIRKGDQILCTREPLENEWMPGRLGLPGGKYYLNEGVMDGTKRKIAEEAGVECEIKGLFKIIQILMPQKTVYHFIFVADYVSGELDNAQWSDELIWKTESEVAALTKDDLTEYYYHEVLREYFEHPERIFPAETILELRSFEDEDIQEWMRKGTKEIK